MVDEHDVPVFVSTLAERRIGVTFADVQPRIREQLRGKRKQAFPQKADNRPEELDHLDAPYALRLQHVGRGVAETQPAHENGQVVPSVARERLIRQRALRHRVVAAHQQLVIEGDLGDHGAGSGEELSAAQA